MSDKTGMDIVSINAAYRADRATPDGFLTRLLKHIETHDGRIGAFSSISTMLLEDAGKSRDRWQQRCPVGVMDGVPVVVKDNLVSKGLPASWGNAELATRVCLEDEIPVARLRSAGAVVVGKGNCPEFAVEGYTANQTFGATHNPYDPLLTPGGSSGGVVAAVAAGFASVGICTDGGGSLRRPAGYCGLFGLKPGIGRVARGGGLPQVLLDFEVVGPVARSARDITIVDEILSGPSRGDPTSRARYPSRETSTPRVMFVPRLDSAPCDPGILDATRRIADGLADIGCDVRESDLPLNLQPITDAWSAIAEIGLARAFRDDPDVAAVAASKYRAMAERGEAYTGADLWKILNVIRSLRVAASRCFTEIDAILMPSSAAMPWPACDPFPSLIDGQTVGPRGHAIYTGWVNAAGLPAVSVPTPAPGSLPIGAQIIGDLGSEHMLMQLAQELEEAGISCFHPPSL